METGETIREPRRLTRPRDDRWIAGVCAGLGEYFDLNPAIYRIAFAALALAGGTGILLYVAAWLVLPEEGRTTSIATDILEQHRDRPRRVVGLAVLALVAIVALSEARVWPRPGNVWLAVVVGTAALAWWRLGPKATTRTKIVVASIVGAAVLGLVALVASIGVPLFSGIGDRVVRPSAATGVRSKYELGIGNLTLDLGDVAIPRGQTFVNARVGIGNLRVVVPQDASVDVRGSVGIGAVDLLDQSDSGTSVHDHVVDRTGSGRVVVLKARTGLGKVEVERG
jgi:phage shock protein PspC (stress-responsive transcriptional regulator)